MGSSIKSPFLLPSVLVCIVHHTLSERMTLKVIVVLCLVLVGLIEANPVSIEVMSPQGTALQPGPLVLQAAEAPVGELYETDDTEITTSGYEYEYTTDYGYNGNDNDLERKKRSPCLGIKRCKSKYDCICVEDYRKK